MGERTGSALERVLIAGCGDLGSRLGLRLLAAGHEVFGLRRRTEDLPSGIQPVAADLSDPESLRSLPGDLDVVVYAAAAQGRDDESYRRAYVYGPLHLLEALAAQGHALRRFVFCSSTGVYGQDDGSWVDEESPCEPAGFTGRRVLEGEGVSRHGPYPCLIMRIAGIYGPGRTRLIDAVRAGSLPGGDGGPRFSNRIHVEDAAGALAHLLALEAPEETYVGVDDDPADLLLVGRWLAGRLGVRPPAPPPGHGQDPRGKRCRNARLRSTGYAFRYPSFREGYAALLRSPS